MKLIFAVLHVSRVVIKQVFTALHGMQTRSSDENSVRPSVRLSVCLSVCLSVRHTREL